MRKTLIISLALALSGCATVSKDVQLRHEGKPEAELVVYREPAFPFLASGSGLYFGEKEKSYIVLSNNEYSRIKIDAGMHEFEARARTHVAPAFKLTVHLEEGKTTCIKAFANPATAGAVFIVSPLLGAVLPSFKLEQVECPSEQFLSEYKLKPLSPATATIQQVTGPPAPSGGSSPAVEERLRVLKDLREKNLITEDEYARERKQALEASRLQPQPGQQASAPSTVTAALPASQERKRWVKVVSAEAEIFEAKPEKGVVAAVLELAKRGDTLEYTGQKEYRGGSYVRSGTYLEVKNREGKPGWIHEADVVESSRD